MEPTNSKIVRHHRTELTFLALFFLCHSAYFSTGSTDTTLSISFASCRRAARFFRQIARGTFFSNFPMSLFSDSTIRHTCSTFSTFSFHPAVALASAYFTAMMGASEKSAGIDRGSEKRISFISTVASVIHAIISDDSF